MTCSCKWKSLAAIHGELADLNDPVMGEQHMRLEEAKILPYLNEGEKRRIVSDHAIFRNYRRQGIRIPESLMTAHSRYEENLAAKYGL
jgi:hypothetical protein